MKYKLFILICFELLFGLFSFASDVPIVYQELYFRVKYSLCYQVPGTEFDDKKVSGFDCIIDLNKADLPDLSKGKYSIGIVEQIDSQPYETKSIGTGASGEFFRISSLRNYSKLQLEQELEANGILIRINYTGPKVDN